jgi:hypothetical protein
MAKRIVNLGIIIAQAKFRLLRQIWNLALCLVFSGLDTNFPQVVFEMELARRPLLPEYQKLFGAYFAKVEQQPDIGK